MENLKKKENTDSKKKDPEERYTNIIWELNELTNDETEDDNVDVVNKDLDNAFKNFLEENPDKLWELRQKVVSLWETAKETRWKGFDLLVKFLGNVDKKLKDDYNEFLEKLKEPHKLSNMNNKEIWRVKLYLQSNKNDSIKAYTEMKNVDWWNKANEKDKAVFNEIWNTLKVKYQNDSDFLKEDFNDINTSVDSLKKYAGNDWNGENLWSDVTLQNFDSDKVIISKEFFINTFNTYNEQRINKVKKNTINWCYNVLASKYDFQKTSNNELQFKLKESNTWSTAIPDIAKKDFADDLKTFIRNQDNLIDNEEDRLLDSWSSDIYKALLDNSEVNIPEDTQNQGMDWPKIDNIAGNKLEMEERDFKAMQDYLKGDMFIIKNVNEENNISYSYDLGKVKKYLLRSGNNDNESLFKLSTTSGVLRRTRISAIQILLNSRVSGEWTKIKVDWKFWINGDYYAWETHEAVLEFQKEYNISHPDNTIAEDWVPGPITIDALLKEE